MTNIGALYAPPVEDAGARTADLYHWQAAMAAADAFTLLTQSFAQGWTIQDQTAARIVCEYHEDWLIQARGEIELVSAKHRESATGPWTTINALMDSGGMAHLFARWLALGKQTSSRLVSSVAASKLGSELERCTGLAKKKLQGVELDDGEETLLSQTIDASAKSLLLLKRGLPIDWQAPEGATAKTVAVQQEQRQTLLMFLASFIFDLERPSRQLVRHAAPSLYVEPLLALLNAPSALAPIVWSTVLPLFEARMRSRGPGDTSDVPPVAAAQSNADPSQAIIAARSMNLTELLLAVRSVLANPNAYAPLSTPVRVTKLSMKLAQGGCSENSIARAERLRLDYKAYRRLREKNIPGSRSERASIERYLLRAADEETNTVRKPTERWGKELWHALSQRFQDEPPTMKGAGLDGDLALGGVCQLTNRCVIWFSPYFDVAEAIENEKSLRGRK